MVRTTWRSTPPAGSLATTGASVSPVTSMKAQAEVLGDVADGGTNDARTRVVPADVGARRMTARVEAVAGLQREIQAADERDPVVDNDRLLVVAVQRPLMRVERAPDLRLPRELLPHRPHVTSRGAEERQRHPGPGEHPDVEPLGQLREQVAKDERLVIPGQREVRREIPARQMHVRVRSPQLLDDRRQRLRTVDQHLDRVTRSRQRLSVHPATPRRIESMLRADPPQTPPMVTEHLARDPIAEPALGRRELPEKCTCHRGPILLGVRRSISRALCCSSAVVCRSASPRPAKLAVGVVAGEDEQERSSARCRVRHARSFSAWWRLR